MSAWAAWAAVPRCKRCKSRVCRCIPVAGYPGLVVVPKPTKLELVK